MTSEGNLKSFSLFRKLLFQNIAWLILFCLCFSCYPVFGAQNVKSSNLVFCPIQRDWVEKYIPQTKAKEPLDNICASGKVKSSFFREVSKNYPLFRFISNSDSVEKFFFNYLKKGKRTLAEIPPFQNVPTPQFFVVAKSERSISNFKKNFIHNRAESFGFAQKARPPTSFAKVSKNIKSFNKLNGISRRIKPRAPPVLI